MTIRLVLILVFSLLGASSSFAEFDSGRSSISVSINNEIYPYHEFATYVLPQEHLGICLQADDYSDIVVSAGSGELDYVAGCRWIWTAPATAGLNEIRFTRGSLELMKINAFVMLPGRRLVNNKIDGVEMGAYPQPLENSPIYQKPDGFIQVTAENVNTAVSPHFVLGQFVTPSDDSYPKYIVLRERLLLKLEILLERLAERGFEAESLSVVSGYMSPAFNADLGGPAQSRHIYGGAASIILDRDADGRMDDLNADDVIDSRDGQILFDLIDELYSEPGKEYLSGGLFLYSNPANAGPVVLIDARGFRKRWVDGNGVPPIPMSLRPKHKRQFR